MKKKVICVIITLVVICAVGMGCLYAVDMNRMNNNKPVFFSTWGYDYAPPVNPLEPPSLQLTDKEGVLQAICLTGSHTWRNGELVTISDYPHPIEREYHEENILETIGNKEIFIDNQNAKITDVRLYQPNTSDMLDYAIPFTDNSVVFDLPNNKEYIAEIMTEQEQGTASYCLKVVKQDE